MTDFFDPALVSLLTGFFVAGFLGSWHCGVMCGPMACFLSSKKQLLNYQVGRMISYTLAGALAGFISQFLLRSQEWLKYVSVGIISILLIMMFLSQNKTIKTPAWLNRFYFKNKESGFILGFLSFLLPCGWLYSFIVSSMASRSAWAGALVMFVFWLSTLPALSAAQLLMKKIIQKSDLQRQRIASFVLLIASLFSLANFLMH